MIYVPLRKKRITDFQDFDLKIFQRFCISELDLVTETPAVELSGLTWLPLVVSFLTALT